jgi:hypothetical protein
LAEYANKGLLIESINGTQTTPYLNGKGGFSGRDV